jgi:type II secretion system protein N
VPSVFGSLADAAAPPPFFRIPESLLLLFFSGIAIILPLMRILLRTLGFITLGLLGLFLVVLVAANLYLQSETVQNRIRQGTAASLGYPVEIGRVFFTPWSGLTLGKLRAANPANPANPEILPFQADSLNIRFAWLPLLSRQFIITSISLNRPELDLSQNQPFVLLPPEKSVQVVLPTDPTAEVTTARPAPEAPSDAEPSAPGETPATPSSPFFTVEVRAFHFINGSLILRDEAGQPTVEARQLNLALHLGKDSSMAGLARVEELILGNALHLRHIEAPFVRQNGVVTIEAFLAELAQGRLSGSAVVEEATQDFQASLALASAQIPVLLEEARIPHGRAEGALNATLEMAGGSDPETWKGTGSLSLTEATLEPLDFLRQVGQLLRISELQLLRLNEARADLVLTGMSLELKNLHLASDNLLIRSSGTIDLKDAELDLQARLMVNEELQRNLGGLLSGFLDASQEPGYREVPFRVYGPVSSPRTDLLDRVGGGTVGREVGRFLQGLFGAPSRPAPSPNE